MPVVKVNHELTKKIIAMYADGAIAEEIAEELGLHKNTVYGKIRKYKNLLKEREQEQEHEIADLLKQLQGDTPREIVHKILNIMNNQEALELEFLERGLDPLNRVLGTISDKVIKLHEIEQKQQHLEEQEVAQDNFFNAMTKILERMTDVESLVDDASLDDE